jgi:alpha-1,6-mannosyltransferase
MAAGVALIAGSMLGLAALQYAMPVSLRYPGPMDTFGARQFALWLGVGALTPMSVGAYIWCFRALVVTAWIGYGVVVYAGVRRGVGRPLTILAVASVLGVALAVLFPSSLSHDLYAYLAFGRMKALYGLNPYVHTLDELARLGDIAAFHYQAPVPTVYGPVWTLLASGLAFVLRALSVPAQLVVFKLVEAAAVVGAALAARAIARVWDPRRADLALVAVALNPLLVLEGPCNGHNDVLMVALMLTGVALVVRSSWKTGYLVIGLSVGVKFVTLAIVPWLILEQVRSMPWSRAGKRAAASIGLVLLPMLCAFAPFWTGLGTLAGLNTVYNTRSSGDAAARLGGLFVIVLYGAMTVWVHRGRGDRLAPAWTVWSAAAILFAIPGILPWYWSWPTAMTLTRWDVRQRILSAGCCLLGLYWMLHYVTLSRG